MEQVASREPVAEPLGTAQDAEHHRPPDPPGPIVQQRSNIRPAYPRTARRSTLASRASHEPAASTATGDDRPDRLDRVPANGMDPVVQIDGRVAVRHEELQAVAE